MEQALSNSVVWREAELDLARQMDRERVRVSLYFRSPPAPRKLGGRPFCPSVVQYAALLRDHSDAKAFERTARFYLLSVAQAEGWLRRYQLLPRKFRRRVERYLAKQSAEAAQ